MAHLPDTHEEVVVVTDAGGTGEAVVGLAPLAVSSEVAIADRSGGSSAWPSRW